MTSFWKWLQASSRFWPFSTFIIWWWILWIIFDEAIEPRVIHTISNSPGKNQLELLYPFCHSVEGEWSAQEIGAKVALLECWDVQQIASSIGLCVQITMTPNMEGWFSPNCSTSTSPSSPAYSCTTTTSSPSSRCAGSASPNSRPSASVAIVWCSQEQDPQDIGHGQDALPPTQIPGLRYESTTQMRTGSLTSRPSAWWSATSNWYRTNTSPRRHASNWMTFRPSPKWIQLPLGNYVWRQLYRHLRLW